MNVLDVLSSPAGLRLILTFVHFLWQGLVIALLAVAAAKTFGRRSPHVRYGIHVVALGAMVLAVCITYAVVQPPVLDPSLAARQGAPATDGEVVAASTNTAGANRVTVTTAETAISPLVSSAASQDGHDSAWQRWLPYAVGAYWIGVLFMIGRLIVGLHGGGRLRKRSQPVEDPSILSALARQARLLGLSCTPAIAYCAKVVLPTVIGVLRPVILLPFSFASGLAGEQIEALLAHELAHIRRLDPLVNVLQRVIEALLFFHPAVWFLSQKIRLEREHCCDDMAVRLGASAPAYAAMLVEMAQRGLAGGTASRLVPQGVGMAGKPSQLQTRVRRLLGKHGHESLRLKWSWLNGVFLIAMVGVAAFAVFGGSFAGEGATEENAQPGGSSERPLFEDTSPEEILDLLRQGIPADDKTPIEVEWLLVKIPRDVYETALEEIAPGSGDPKTQVVILDSEQTKALCTAFQALEGDSSYEFINAPRVTTLRMQTALMELVDENEDGTARSGIRCACTPIVSADHTTIALVLHSKTVIGKSLGSIRLGDVEVVQPSTSQGALMAVYRIPNGGTLVLEGTAPDDKAMMSLVLVSAHTIEEDPAGRRRLEEKLDTIIPEVNFEDAELADVINFLAEIMDIDIVMDPAASAMLEGREGAPMSTLISIHLTNVPLKYVLKYLLRHQDLKYLIRGGALVIVPVDTPEEVPPEIRRHLEEQLNKRIPAVDFQNTNLREIIAFLCRETEVNITIDPRTFADFRDRFTSNDVSLTMRDAPLREVLTSLLKQKGLKYVIRDHAMVVVPLDAPPRKDFETVLFSIASGTRTVVDAQGKSRIETIDEYFRRAPGIIWPAKSQILYHAPSKTLTITNTAANMTVIREKVRAWNEQVKEDAAKELAGAEPAEKPAPFSIKAKDMEIHAEKDENVFTGEACLTCGDITIWADTMVVQYYSHAEHKADPACKGVKRVTCTGHVRVDLGTEQAKGERAEYDFARQTIAVTGSEPSRVAYRREEGEDVSLILADAVIFDLNPDGKTTLAGNTELWINTETREEFLRFDE